jgi:hypothetical protein
MRLFPGRLARGCSRARRLVFLFGFVMADCTAGGRTGNAVIAGNVACNAAYDSTFSAAFGLRGGVGEGECRCDG